ncbi:MAG: hypothetical protein OEW60_00075 [Thiovulaceae bacterium]|nr:hypothetical protein [Sulfurimonadaceae bacterium]
MDDKVRLKIGGSLFDIDLDESFAAEFLPELSHNFNMESNNEIKQLLQAFVKKSYEHYQLKKEVKNSILKLDIQ